jgi:hypothetical protein
MIQRKRRRVKRDDHLTALIPGHGLVIVISWILKIKRDDKIDRCS